jgi:hypothetical protein
MTGYEGRNMPPLKYILYGASVACACVAIASCARAPEGAGSTAVQLPGFTIELPFGRVDKSTSLPSAGAHRMTLLPSWMRPLPLRARDFIQVDEGKASVHWRAGALTPEEHRQLSEIAVNSVARASAFTVTKIVHEENRWLSVLEKGSRRLVMGGVYCEPGLSVQIVLAPTKVAAIEEQAQRMLRSVVCNVGTEVPALPVLGLDLPAEYGRAEVADKDMDIYVSLDGSVVSVSPSDGNLLRLKDAAPLLNQLLSGMLQVSASSLDLQRQDIVHREGHPAALFEARGTGVIPQGGSLIIGAVYCPELELTFLLAMAGETGNKPDAHRITRTSDCSGRFPRSIRPAGDVLGEACDSGSGNACGTLSDLIAEGEATDSTRSVEVLRARACALKAEAWCAETAAR